MRLELISIKIDEAFIPITIQTEEDFVAIQNKVKKWTGIPVSIGLAPTKTLAKIANHYAKKRDLGTFSLLHSEERERVLKSHS